VALETTIPLAYCQARTQSQPAKALAAMQNSLPSGSCITVQLWPGIWSSRTTVARSPTSVSTADGSGSTRSRCTRFFACFDSGTSAKYQAASLLAASVPPIEAHTALLVESSGRSSTADQKVATFSTSSQSKAMLPILAVMRMS
jgi:hypothetical protein